MTRGIEKELRPLRRLLKALGYKVDNVRSYYGDAISVMAPLMLASAMAAIKLLAFDRFLTLHGSQLVQKLMVMFYVNTIWMKGLATLFGIIAFRKDSAKLWLRLAELDQKFEPLKLKHEHEHERESRFFQCLALMVGTFSVHLCLGFVTFFSNEFYPSATDLFLYGVMLVLRFYEHAIKLQYLASMTLFKNSYAQLNELVGNMGHERVENERIALLAAVMECHQALTESVRLLHDVVAPQLLAVFNEAFIRLVGHTYSIIATFMFQDHMFDLVVSFVNFFDAICNHYLMIVPAQRCSVQANRMKRILQKVSNGERKESVLRNMNVLSVQLLHDDLNLSLVGFFSLDYTTIFNIASSLTANLVILVQFRQLYD